VGLALRHLDDDPRTRQYMGTEVDADIEAGTLYLGKYLSPSGRAAWPEALRQAVSSHDDDWLIANMASSAYWLEQHQQSKPSGGSTWARVPRTAPQMLGEGEYNRFYIRGVCLRAIADGIDHIQVVRVKHVGHPRPESEQLIGTLLDPAEVLADLRNNPGAPTFLGVPMGPNSGLGVEIPVLAESS
jgi:hypothetical protein